MDYNKTLSILSYAKEYFNNGKLSEEEYLNLLNTIEEDILRTEIDKPDNQLVSNSVLAQYLIFDSNKENYTDEEIEIIQTSILKDCNDKLRRL